jgi:hypothetical protein
MTNRQRFRNVLRFIKPDDRLPMIEWADWWDKTLERWEKDGLELNGMDAGELRDYFGLDMVRQFWFRPLKNTFPHHESHGPNLVESPEDYYELKKHMYPEDPLAPHLDRMLEFKELHDRGDMVIWLTLDGFFWNPRRLFGIENHMYAFFDYPELMHEMNEDLAEHHIFVVEEFCKIIKPDFMTFAEDMSYNHGPMISYELFREFLEPYYRKVIPVLKKYDIVPFIDSDGNVEKMVPWLTEAGIEGVLPLERQAGTDIVAIREKYPEFKMIGGYDKMVMDKGEEAMRKEFERLLPVMKSGGYIPSCDHQTPPAVSLDDYRLYLKLFEEYCKKAVE